MKKENKLKTIFIILNIVIIAFIAYSPTLYIDTSLSWWVFGIIAYIVMLLVDYLTTNDFGDSFAKHAEGIVLCNYTLDKFAPSLSAVGFYQTLIVFGLLNIIYWIF